MYFFFFFWEKNVLIKNLKKARQEWTSEYNQMGNSDFQQQGVEKN